LQPKTLQANLSTLEDEGVATELEDEPPDEDNEWGFAEGIVGVVCVGICDESVDEVNAGGVTKLLVVEG
jgi:hypothetical protein